MTPKKGGYTTPAPVLDLGDFPPSGIKPQLCALCSGGHEACTAQGCFALLIPTPPSENNTKVPKFDGNSTKCCSDKGVVLATRGRRGGGTAHCNSYALLNLEIGPRPSGPEGEHYNISRADEMQLSML